MSVTLWTDLVTEFTWCSVPLYSLLPFHHYSHNMVQT